MSVTNSLKLHVIMFVAIALCAVVPLSRVVAKSGCSTQMYNRADSSLAGANGSWPSLFRHQQAFGSCDDGALAEGYSDAVVNLLANRWDRFDQLDNLSKRHPGFRFWVIQHIDPSAAEDDLNKIIRNAATCRPRTNAKSFCVEVRHAATNALMQQG